MVLIMISGSFISAQHLKNISGPEKIWALSHPFIAKKAFRLSKEVLLICDSLKKDTILGLDANGGMLDAFRHCYWMALLCQHISPRKAYDLGLAHEKGNRFTFFKNKTEDGGMQDSMMCVMDIVNDQLGIQYGLANKNSVRPMSDHDLIEFIAVQDKEGKLRKLLKNSENKFLMCDGTVIDENEFKGKWAVPKCLVPTNVFISY